MSRSDRDRLLDIQIACETIATYLARGDVGDIVFDAVRVRLIEIGEAVKDLAPTTLAGEPSIPWVEVSPMRDQLTHRYFDTTHSVVRATAVNDVPILAAAVRRLLSDHPWSETA